MSPCPWLFSLLSGLPKVKKKDTTLNANFQHYTDGMSEGKSNSQSHIILVILKHPCWYEPTFMNERLKTPFEYCIQETDRYDCVPTSPRLCSLLTHKHHYKTNFSETRGSDNTASLLKRITANIKASGSPQGTVSHVLLQCATDDHLDAISQCRLRFFNALFYEKPSHLRNRQSSTWSKIANSFHLVCTYYSVRKLLYVFVTIIEYKLGLMPAMYKRKDYLEKSSRLYIITWKPHYLSWLCSVKLPQTLN
jgi:hypothetical protein